MLNTPVLIWYKVTQHLGCTVLGWGDRWGTPGVADIDAGERQPGCVESPHLCIVPESVSGRAFLGCPTTITRVGEKVYLFISRPLTSTPASSSATFAAKATWTARASSLTAGSCTASSSRARPSSSGDPNPGSPKPALRRPSRLTFQLTSRPRRN